MIGYSCFEHHGFVWRSHQATLLPGSLPHCDPSYGADVIRKLVVQRNALLARWDQGFDQLQGGEWWHIIKDQPEDIMALSGSTRSKVRRGSKNFTCAPVARERIVAEGYAVDCAAFERYKTFESVLSEDAFRQAVMQLPDATEFWGVRHKPSGELVAFSENLVKQDACFYVTIWFTPESLKQYSAYLLFHEMNKHYLNERAIKYVSDGARSISHDTKIHDFLEEKFGFRKAYSRLSVVYHPLLGPLVNTLFPFRSLIRAVPWGIFQKASVVLEQERIRRSCLKVS